MSAGFTTVCCFESEAIVEEYLVSVSGFSERLSKKEGSVSTNEESDPRQSFAEDKKSEYVKFLKSIVFAFLLACLVLFLGTYCSIWFTCDEGASSAGGEGRGGALSCSASSAESTNGGAETSVSGASSRDISSSPSVSDASTVVLLVGVSLSPSHDKISEVSES